MGTTTLRHYYGCPQFIVESCAEHLRQHERVSDADRMVQDAVRPFDSGTPTVTHLSTVGKF